MKWAAANVAIAVAATAAALALGEASLRFVLPASSAYYVFAPNSTTVTTPLTELMPGVEGAAEFRTNSFGVRGDDFGPDGSEYRILTLGGSTAQNVYLDQSEAWPLMVGELLGPTVDGRPTWSGTVGRSGATVRTNLLQFEYLLTSLPKIDAVVMLLGINDLGVTLRDGWTYRPPPPLTDASTRALHMRQAFVRVPGRLHEQFPQASGEETPFYRRLAVWQVARLARDAWVMRGGSQQQDQFGQTLAVWRAHRQSAALIHDSLPPLEAPLEAYRNHLRSIADLAERHGVRLILMTQPVLWRDDLTNREEQLLWMGGTGDFQSHPGEAYYGAGPLAEGMRRYNDVLLSVCLERRLECVDLAGAVPADTTMFYDDVHPTERGAAMFAETLAAYLRGHPPYSVAR